MGTLGHAVFRISGVACGSGDWKAQNSRALAQSIDGAVGTVSGAGLAPVGRTASIQARRAGAHGMDFKNATIPIKPHDGESASPLMDLPRRPAGTTLGP